MTVEYLIIGTGAAGIAAAKAIRKNDQEGRVVIVSDDSYMPYYRTRLTKAIPLDLRPEELNMEKEDFFEKNQIELWLNQKVDAIDYDTKTVHIDGGAEVVYDKLLLATGAQPFIPPYEGGDMHNVFSMRSMNDYLAVQEALEVDDVKTVLVVGGGLLGLEAAYAFLEKGLEVHVGEFAEHLLTKQLDTPSSIGLEEALTQEGLKIHLGSTLKEIVGDDKVRKVILTGGEEIDCQLVLFSVGVRPEITLAGNSLEVNRGIVANEKLETSAEDVWVAGDNAEVNGVVMGLWTAANEMGQIAGDNMSGGNSAYTTPKLFTNLHIGKTKFFSAGSHEGDDCFEKSDGKNFVKIFLQDGIVVGGILAGNTAMMAAVNKLIEEKADRQRVEETFL